MQLSEVLSDAQWRARRAAHERRADELLAGHRRRRRERQAHPVEDFLFTYYSLRPARLRRWQPGHGFALVGADPAELGAEHHLDAAGRAEVDLAAVLARRGESVGWIHRLLTATAGRPAQHGCFGLHEWAMVYRSGPEAIRHRQLPLRLGERATAAVVERLPVRCSHFDAFRFFTDPARPLNQLQPTRARQLELEQPGCLHANMDLYKWAYKLAPLTGGELLLDCFELARDIRVLDMRASPYDLDSLGLTPVPIETPAGRADYVRAQREFAVRAQRLRTRLIAVAAVAVRLMARG